MPKKRKHAEEKCSTPERRQNAQGDHKGSAQSTVESDVVNPQKQGFGDRNPIKNHEIRVEARLHRDRVAETVHPDDGGERSFPPGQFKPSIEPP